MTAIARGGMKKSALLGIIVFVFLLSWAFVGAKAGYVYNYNDPKTIRSDSYADIERTVDPDNGVVCYTATKGGLGIGISCLQTR